MEHLKGFLILLILSASHAAETKKPVAVARTELKVSRSLDPSSMQTVNVVTKDGTIAQLIVKRRDGKSQPTTSAPVTGDTERVMSDTITSNWVPIPSGSTLDDVQLETVNKNIGNQISDEGAHKLGVPRPVTIVSENVFVKGQADDGKKGRSILRVESDGIPVIHGIRVPDDDTDVKVWRNARVINGELVPYEKNYVPQQAVPVGELVYKSKQEANKDIGSGTGPFTTADNYAYANRAQPNIGPFTVDDNKQLADEKYNGNRNSYVRFNSERGIGPFTKVDNTRIANSKLIDYIKQINEQESKRDYFTGKRYDQEATDSHQIQRRMLYYGGAHSYPNSLLYTPQSTKLSRVNFNDGVRTPVLQYAHPELGVQPAKVSNENDDYKTEKERNSIYYTNLPNERNFMEEQSNDYMNSGRNSDKPNKYYENDYYRRNEMGYSHTPYYKYKQTVEPPFWIKIGDTIRDNVQTGIARMQQFTRPVLDPIVEATQKIGHNLGLTRLAPEAQAQDKIGVGPPVIGSSVILPALGLVAGGAALGFGAAAVGRLLDIGNMRSQDGTGYIDQAEMQHKRALQAYGDNEDFILIVQPNGKDQSDRDNAARTKRSVKAAEDDKYFDRLIQSVERDLHAGSLGSHLAGNNAWADTPCAKRMFCDVMVKQSYEEVLFMEKKMDSFLSMVHPVIVNSVSQHLHDVLDAVRSQDCSRFICHEPYTTPK